jgi:uncharacterized membrane protein
MTFETRQLVRSGWNTYKKNTWFWVGLLLLSYLLNFLGSMTHLGSLINIFTWFVLSSAFLRTSRGILVDFNNLFGDLAGGKFVQYVLASVVVGVFVVVGCFLLVIPGIIVATMLAFTTYIILDEPKTLSWKSDSFWKAIKKSVALTKGARWHLFCFFLVLFGLNIVGALIFGIGLLVTLPVSGIASATLYDMFRGAQPIVPQQ